MVSLRSRVAVPSSVRPLPLDQRLGESCNAFVLSEPKAAAHGESVAFLRGTPLGEPVNFRNVGKVRLAGQPVENLIDSLSGIIFSGDC